MKRTHKSTLALIIAIILCVTNMAAVVSLADTTQSECTIEGVKIWEDNNDEKGLRPESITVDLYKDNHKVASTTASANSGWKFSFNVDSYLDENGDPIDYSIKEQPVENYEQTALVNPVVTKAITIESFGKYTPNSELTISVSTVMIVIKKGNDWTVWTEKALSAEEQAQALPEIREKGNINQNASIEFYTGDIGNGITIDTENDTITFSKKSQWSWLYAGEISFARISVASITNTLSETESTMVLEND
ncbi:MAG: Cna B-type domain-containing protein, partial [Oscillospiraceae bacterium]|nr:Cna B-type domain-containing protein [Oscillospiraceae bacterium]